MQHFYLPDIGASDRVILEPEEARHCIKVLRKGRGDRISLLDGKGGVYEAEILDDNVKHCELHILDKKQDGQRPFKLWLAVAPTKNIDRFEWLLEKTTEIGVERITPLLCEHSERRKLKNERLDKILVSAMKQSGHTYLPQLDELRAFDKFMGDFATTVSFEKYIAVCEDDLAHLKDHYPKGKNALILIGPEGDFSVKEKKAAKDKGFQPISLGKSRLRTETAAIVACDVINLMNV